MEETQPTMTEQAITEAPAEVGNVTQALDQEQEKDYLAELVGEGRKYSSIEEAAKALAKKAIHADQFIETLKEESRQKDEALAKARTVDEIMEALKGSSNTEVERVVAQETQTEIPESVNLDIPSEVRKYLEAEEAKKKQQAQQEQAKANQEKSWKLLQEKVGDLDNAKKLVRDYVGEDTAKRQMVDLLANSNPEELVRIVTSAVPSDKVVPSSPRKHISISENEVLTDNNLTWEKVWKIKKENPRLFNSPKFQSLLHKGDIK